MTSSFPHPIPAQLPPLENGDHLSSQEFERRYHAMPHVHKAELIEGKVYMPCPLRARGHGQPHAHIMGWLAVYVAATPGVDVLDNPTVRLDLDNTPQPDAILRIEGGRSSISTDDYVEGAPELIVEIAASSASYDLYEKRQVYRRNQVQEYLVWRVYDRQFDWFCLDQGNYVTLEPGADGILRSGAFPGLWLAPAALLAGNLAIALQVGRQGTETQAHQAFVEQLAASARQGLE